MRCRGLILVVPLAAGLLAGCAERWDRPGATEAESEAAQQGCTAQAAVQVPQALVWAQTAPGYWQPGERRCRTREGVTDCVTRPGRYVPAQFGWVDANASLRQDARAQCLAEAGWTYRGLRPLRLW